MKCIVNLLDDEKFETELAVSSHSMLSAEIVRHLCVVMRIVNTDSWSDLKSVECAALPLAIARSFKLY